MKDTERLSKLARTGDFDPPCDWSCEGIIAIEIDGERVSGACPVMMTHPACEIPKREAYERVREMRARGFPAKYLKEGTWEKCQAKDLLQDWLSDRPKPGLLIHGPVGTGKTMAAVLAAQVLWSEGLQGRFVPWPQLLMELEKTDTRPDAIRLYAETGLLILDDFGVGEMAPWVRGYVDLIFERRNSSGKAIFVTTNLTPESLREEIAWSRFVDRWAESMVALAMPGRSMRRG